MQNAVDFLTVFRHESTEKVLNKDGEEITFPYTHSKGSVSIKIYCTPTRGCDSYTLSYRQDGARKRPTFTTFDRALKEAKAVALKLGSAPPPYSCRFNSFR
jgi:hypothetical protein